MVKCIIYAYGKVVVDSARCNLVNSNFGCMAGFLFSGEFNICT